MSMKVMRPGLLTSVQDLGRYGYQKQGVIVSGAMDPYSLRIANLLVGNHEGEAALELTLMGPELSIEQDTLLSITGGNLSPAIDGTPVPMWRPVYVKAGTVLSFGPCKSGCRAYLAVAGGFDIPQVMGSKSTYLRAGIGGLHGRALATGDILQQQPPGEASGRVRQALAAKIGARSCAAASWYTERGYMLAGTGEVKVRAMRGTQFDKFNEDSQRHFFGEPFQVTPQSDRMGYRLSGEALMLKAPQEMISEAVTLGTVQVPPDGNPIVLLADRQTAGGYPRIAQIAAVDIAKIAQMQPGKKIVFEEITVAEAERLYIEQERNIVNLKMAISLKTT
ncbi:biotin-dependent carboxyltransferase family protein [Paenibacillus xerothermodurans]|uniref:Allophanate hydrolase subunit 2 family protein n=1 Tax=Paenibacillus xerothermodurans TaxID=1977292 RepID=A0A2W1N6A0_PAEXE|nr:biotin-dependent carboxyltransferase family protein [Paenibacillus xerothermodurans]PZE19344.1 allophanate hydrolase subunit 2 family protein [Paenibacillus xerothermodurans]